tara:strand:+ start:3098 stop:3391 length:294 start_codon:yes stop_codon:yes gene_type:complete
MKDTTKPRYLLVKTPVDHTEGTRIRNEEIALAKKVKTEAKSFVRAAQLEIKQLKSLAVPNFIYEQIEVYEGHPKYDEAELAPEFGIPLKKVTIKEKD